MNPSLPSTPPLCCAAPAYQLFQSQIRQIPTCNGLLKASVALSMHQLSHAQFKDIERELSGYAKMIRSRVRGCQPQAMIAHLHQYLFDELGYAGNTEDYYAPANSYLPEVVASKRGLPITLSLVYKLVADKLGLKVSGIGLPGHFLVAVHTEPGLMYIDTFSGGRCLSAAECRQRVESIFSDTVPWSDQMLKPVTHRMWVSRMIQNLLHIFTTNQQWSDVAAMLELQMLLWPKQTQLKRDLGLVLARIDMPEPASRCLGEYLQANPDDPEKQELSDLLAKLSR